MFMCKSGRDCLPHAKGSVESKKFNGGDDSSGETDVKLSHPYGLHSSQAKGQAPSKQINAEQKSSTAASTPARRLAMTLTVLALAGVQMACTSGPMQAAQTPIERNVRTAAQASPEKAHLYNQYADLRSPINSENVRDMQLAWSVPTKDFVTHEPLASDGRVFFADWGGNVYAVDRDSGKTIWKKTVQEEVMKEWPWHGFAGTGALGEGMLFEVSVEGRGYAIDQKTGDVVWQVEVAEDPQAGNVGEVLYYDGLVYVGLSSVEEPLDKMASKKGKTYPVDFQGKVIALDAKTGKQVWERQLVTPPANGVAVWSSFALDPDTGTLYFTTGNNYTDIGTEFSDALIAADAKTGKIRWANQVLENDIWTGGRPKGPDYDFAAGPQLFEAKIDGKTRKLVGAGQKSGIFYVWDRESGDLVWTTTVGYGNVGGGIHAEASIGDGRMYIWGNNGYTYGAPPEKHPLDVKAVNAATGEYLWVKNKVQPALLSSTGFLANDVYFVGSLDGKVRAYNAKNGETIWTSKQHGAVGSDIQVDKEMVIWGAGVPKSFAGDPERQNGVFAYKAGGDKVAVTPDSPQQQASSAQ